MSQSDFDLTFDLAVVILTFKILSRPFYIWYGHWLGGVGV